MFRFLKTIGLALAVIGTASSARAFALLGLPDAAYQVNGIGYQLFGNSWNLDVGGPMNLGEEYRWNVPVITYGFDRTFIEYFGQRGMNEVRKAVAILNDLPPMSKLSSDLHEFQTDTRRQNYRAQALLALDVKSTALAFLVNVLGLASPERYVFTLRSRIPLVGGGNEYHIIMRSFDPVTQVPSPYVNDVLYTWRIGPTFPMFPQTSAGDVDLTLTIPVDPTAPAYTSVAAGADSQLGVPFTLGDFYTGLTRDDMGGLRYIYTGKGRFANYNVEGVLQTVNTNTTAGGSAGSVGTQLVVPIAVRPGVNKVRFKEVKYDSTIGFFDIRTNTFSDTYITNGIRVKQRLERQLIAPEIIFFAGDLDAGGFFRQFGNVVGTPGNWVNNAELDGFTRGSAGPGIIQPDAQNAPIVLAFNNVGPLFGNWDFPTGPDVTDQQNSVTNFVWASFDGTTNEPFIYPVGPDGRPAITAREREQQIMRNRNR